MKKYNITVNGTVYEVEVEEVGGAFTPSAVAVPTAAPAAPVATPAAAPASAAAPAPAPAAAPAATGAAGSVKITAPMPGSILKINVTAGQAVAKGDVLCVLEAMKMENEIMAPSDGTVASVNTQKGASVNSGDLLLTLA